MDSATAPRLKRPSFTTKTPRSDELRLGATRLWNNSSLRKRVLFESWSQIPLAFVAIIGPYLLLMLDKPGQIGTLACLVSIALGGVAMGGIFHDSNHRAVFSPTGLSRRYDYILAWLSSDCILGLSSYHWANKHEVHHSNTNILGLDGDLDLEPLMRLHPAKAIVKICRFQHFYVWLLYPFMLGPLHIKGHCVALFGGKHGSSPLKRCRGWELAGTISGMMVFYAWTLILPIYVYGLNGLWCFFAIIGSVGFIYALAFQLAHCVDSVSYPTIEELVSERKESYIHQLETTANFCPNNALLRWFLGGLTHQTEHHLFRRYPHSFYRFLAPLVEEWCQRHNAPYHVEATLRSAIAAHYRHLRAMGARGEISEIEMG
jgi:linoleoyl-CoA desaturase